MCIDIIWLRRSKPSDINPPYLFAGYENAIFDMERAPATNDDPKLLAQAWKVFDNDGTRRNSIDGRAGALMPAISLIATLVTGVGFSVLKDTTLPPDARYVILATLLLSLIYLLRTMILIFVIHGRIFRFTPDPSDLPVPPTPAAGSSLYDRQIACKIMRYTVENFQINNIQSDALFVAATQLLSLRSAGLSSAV